MKTKTLFVKVGAATHKVADVQILPHKTQPDAIVWGSRIFIRDKISGEYVEGFAVQAINVAAPSNG